MSRTKITYTDCSTFFGGTNWSCDIRDRKTDEVYTGYGETKGKAKDAAWDKYYSEKDQRRTYIDTSGSNSIISNYASGSTSTWEFRGVHMRLILLVLAVLFGYFSVWGYDFFHESKNGSPSLGPLFGILVMISSAIISCILAFLVLFDNWDN